MGHVFISYSRDDRAYVDKLAAHLESAGVRVWYDFQLTTGERWSDVIIGKIETCEKMIVVMSPAAAASTMVENEIDLARSRGKEFVPLLLKGEPLFGLRHIQFTDVRSGSLPGRAFMTLMRTSVPAVEEHQPVRQEPMTASSPLVMIEPVLVRTLASEYCLRPALAYSPDGARIAAGTGNTVRIWDAATGALQRALDHATYVNSVTFSPDGKYLGIGANGSRGDQSVHVWTATGTLHQSITGYSGSVNSVAYSSDSAHFATASGNEVDIWDSATRTHRRTLVGHRSPVYGVAWSPDGAWLATASGDQTVRIWQSATGAHRRTLTGHRYWVRSVAYSSNAMYLATASEDNTVRIWDAGTLVHRQTLTGHADGVRSVAFSPDSARLATGSLDRSVRIWDAGTGAHRYTLTDHSGEVHSVAYSPDGSHLAAIGNDGKLCIWRVAERA